MFNKISLFLIILLKQLHLFAAGHAVPWELIEQYVPPNPIVLEAGAQFGEDVGIKCELWPNGLIHAFEPMPNHYKELVQLKNKYSNLETYEIALAESEGFANMYDAGGASSLLRPSDWTNRDYFHSDLNHPIVVPCTTLEKWALTNGVNKIDFMWIDIEGMELQMLKHSGNLLETCSVIFIEGNYQEFWKNATLYKDLKPFLEEKGFHVVWQSIQKNWNGNFLFVK